MEYSLARSLEGFTDIVYSSHPHIYPDPAFDLVNPGLGHVINLYSTFVPIQGHSLHSIEKIVPNDDEIKPNVSEHLTEQKGSGNEKLDPEILKSFQHPILTDSIVFPKIDKAIKKTPAVKRPSSAEKSSSKRLKTEHKFNVV